MRKFLLAAILISTPLGLTGCATIPTTPVEVSDHTKLDEQVAISANLAYKAFRLAVETGVESGIIKGQLAAKIALVDNDLFEAIRAVDTAYRASNSASLADAVTRFNGLLAQGNALIPRKGN